MRMNKRFVAILGFVLIVAIGMALWYAYPALYGAYVAWRSPRTPIWKYVPSTTTVATSSAPNASTTMREPLPAVPLTVPAGFTIQAFAADLPGARVIAFDELGNLWVTLLNQGTLVRLDISRGRVVDREVVLKNLRKPHGLAFDPSHPSNLYIATETALYRLEVYTSSSPVKILDFPAGGRHTTRTLSFGPDGRLYISLGSSCDVCVEKEPRLATIESVKPDGTDRRTIAEGLRNAVFMAWHPTLKNLWVTEMGRDFLGNTTPPDEVNIVTEGAHYGWPWCYGNNVRDAAFNRDTVNNPCASSRFTPAHVNLPAHVAPLGITFVSPDSSWPESYRYHALVAFHGSWNSTKPVGYEVVRLKLDANGRYYSSEPFISGWLKPNETFGRPVDLVWGSDSALYISDDKAGAIYRVEHQ